MATYDKILYDEYDTIDDETEEEGKVLGVPKSEGKYCILIILLPIALIVGGFYAGILNN